MKILMCEPTYYEIAYEINPWMDTSQKVNKTLAQEQWSHLKMTLENCGADVELINPRPNLPDMTFTSSAALVHGSKIFLSHYRYPERQGEEEHFKAWFELSGFEIYTEDEQSFEGASDALFLNQTLFAGFGFRSEQRFYARLEEYNISHIVYCELKDPDFFQLDLAFCPIDHNRAIWYPNAFSTTAQTNMQKQAELIAIPKNEAHRFACNAIVLDDKIIIPSDCPKTKKLLTSLNFTVFECPMSEFIKAGGACKSLTLQLS